MLEMLGLVEICIILTLYHHFLPRTASLRWHPLPLLICKASNVLHDLIVRKDGRVHLIVVWVETDHVLILDLQIIGRLVHT